MLQRKIFAGIGLALLLGSSPVYATPFPTLANDVGVCDPNNPTHCVAPDASGNMPVTGTFTATLGGFTPSASGARGTPVSVTTSDSSGTLPTGAVVAVTNVGANPMYCNVNGIAATTSDQYISSSGGWFAFTIPAAVTTLHCIATGSSTTANTVGGSGLPTGTGGGGGSGGGGAVTLASGAVASGAYSAGAYAAGAVVAGAFVDGWDVTQGLKTDAACAGDNTSGCSVEARLQRIAQNLTTLNTTAGSSIPAGSFIIGKTGIDQTTPGTTNAVSVQYGSTASVADPCQTATKVYTPINVVTATNTIITGVAAKKKYICGIFLYPAGTDNIAIFQATTATACVTALVGVIGGTTTATGIVATAQAGFVLGNGASAVAATTVNQTDLCIVTSAAVQLSGVVVTVDQ